MGLSLKEREGVKGFRVMNGWVSDKPVLNAVVLLYLLFVGASSLPMPAFETGRMESVGSQ